MSSDPSPRQLELLDRVREQLSGGLSATDVTITEHWKHYEDEELGFPSLGSSAGFRIRGAPFPIDVSTPVPWGRDPTGRIEASVYDHHTGRFDGDPWAILVTTAVHRGFGELGFDDEVGYFRASWRASKRAKAIAHTLERLARIPVRVLRPGDLPRGTKWPHHWMLRLMAADALVDCRADGAEQHDVLERDGRRSTHTMNHAESALVCAWHRA